MNRPTRQLRNLASKLERKAAVSRKTGKKAKRWKKFSESYKALSADHQEG